MNTLLSSHFNLVYEMKFTVLWAMIALMMKAVRTSETSVIINLTTQRYIPEDSKLHTRRRENLKCHIVETGCSPVVLQTAQ